MLHVYTFLTLNIDLTPGCGVMVACVCVCVSFVLGKGKLVTGQQALHPIAGGVHTAE